MKWLFAVVVLVASVGQVQAGLISSSFNMTARAEAGPNVGLTIDTDNQSQGATINPLRNSPEIDSRY